MKALNMEMSRVFDKNGNVKKGYRPADQPPVRPGYNNLKLRLQSGGFRKRLTSR